MSGFLPAQHSEGLSAQEQDPALPLAHQLSPPVVLRSAVAAAPAVQRDAQWLLKALEQPLQKLKTDVGSTDADAKRSIAAHAQNRGQSPAS